MQYKRETLLQLSTHYAS